MNKQSYKQWFESIETPWMKKDSRKKLLFAYSKMTFWLFILMLSYTIPVTLIIRAITGAFSAFLPAVITWTLIPGILGLLAIVALFRRNVDAVDLATRIWKRINLIMLWHTLWLIRKSEKNIFELLS